MENTDSVKDADHKGNNRTLKYFLLILITICCVLPFLYFVVFRYIDAYVCLPKVAEKLNIKQSDKVMDLINQIDIYIKNALVEGMSHDQVLSKLEEIGTVDLRNNKQVLPDGLIVETVDIRMCKHYLNNPLLFLYFKADGKLHRMVIYEFP